MIHCKLEDVDFAIANHEDGANGNQLAQVTQLI